MYINSVVVASKTLLQDFPPKISYDQVLHKKKYFVSSIDETTVQHEKVDGFGKFKSFPCRTSRYA